MGTGLMPLRYHNEVALGGADRIAIDATGLDLSAPAPLDGVVEADHDRGAARHQSVDQLQQQMAAARGDHTARLRMRWKVRKSGARSRPRMRSVAVTVRRPGARIAPASSSGTCDQADG